MHVFKNPPASRKQSRRPPKNQGASPPAARDDGASEQTEVKLNETSAILAALIALKRGNSDVRLPEEWSGQAGRIAEAFNEVVELNVRQQYRRRQVMQKFWPFVEEGGVVLVAFDDEMFSFSHSKA